MTETQPGRCYIHPDRETRITCRRCGRGICAQCMVPAAVGFQCPACVREGLKATRQNRAMFGGVRSGNPRMTSIVVIVINAVVWGVIQLAGPFRDTLVHFLGLMPQGMCEATNQAGFYPTAGKAVCEALGNAHWVQGVADGAWWQIFTSIFTHVTLMHIAANCLTLWFIGPPLEAIIGRARFIATYLVAGLFGSLLVMWLAPVYSVSYGGSGSLFGLMGALLILEWRRKMDVRQLLFWLGLNVVITVVGMGSISWQAHLGGLVGGALMAVVLVFMPRVKGGVQWGAIVGLGAVACAGIVARAVMLMGG